MIFCSKPKTPQIYIWCDRNRRRKRYEDLRAHWGHRILLYKPNDPRGCCCRLPLCRAAKKNESHRAVAPTAIWDRVNEIKYKPMTVRAHWFASSAAPKNRDHAIAFSYYSSERLFKRDWPHNGKWLIPIKHATRIQHQHQHKHTVYEWARRVNGFCEFRQSLSISNNDLLSRDRWKDRGFGVRLHPENRTTLAFLNLIYILFVWCCATLKIYINMDCGLATSVCNCTFENGPKEDARDHCGWKHTHLALRASI